MVDTNDKRIINKPISDEIVNEEEIIIDNELDQLLHLRDQKRKKTEQQIIDEANIKAEKIIEQAKLDAEKLKVLAYEEGKNEGISEGYQAGLGEAEKAVQMAEEQIKVNKLKYEEQLKQLEPKFAKVVIQVIEKLTGQLLQDKNEIIINIINQGMMEINNSNRSFLIKVSQDDYEYVIENANKVEGCLNPTNKIDFCVDNQLEKGSCIIETDSGFVNSSIDIQLKGIISDLRLIAGL
ncbi:MAG: hypothetical protein K0R15_1169 [Clostridiales bacterium]|jgi:flagellar assembly protein FliH|nr:hypothetical protein [Clostridiales bacterium]